MIKVGTALYVIESPDDPYVNVGYFRSQLPALIFVPPPFSTDSLEIIND